MYDHPPQPVKWTSKSKLDFPPCFSLTSVFFTIVFLAFFSRLETETQALEGVCWVYFGVKLLEADSIAKLR